MAELPKPERKVLAPGPVGLVEPRGQMANAYTAGVLAKLADQVHSTIFDIASADAKKRAKKEADSYIFDRDPVTGHIVPPSSPTSNGLPIPNIYDEEYHNALADRYQMQALDKAQTDINSIAARNESNPSGYAEEVESYRQGFLKNVPKEQAGLFDTSISRMTVPYMNQINNNRAKIDHAINQKTTMGYIEKNILDYQRMLFNGATTEELYGIADRIGKVLDKATLDGTFNPLERAGLDKMVLAYGAKASITNNLIQSGVNPGSEEGQRLFESAINGVMEGNYEVDILGRKQNVGNILSEDERADVAKKLNILSSHYATMDRLSKGIASDLYIKNVLIPNTLQAITQGIPMNKLELAQQIARTTDPEMQLQILEAFGSINNAADNYVADQTSGNIITSQIFSMMSVLENNPLLKQSMEAMFRQSPDQRLSSIELLNETGFHGQAAEAMREMESDLASLRANKLTGADKEVYEALATLNARTTQQRENCNARYSDNVEALNQCLAAMPIIENVSSDANKIVAGTIVNQIASNAGVDSINWGSDDESQVALQNAAVTKLSSIGVFHPDLIDFMTNAATDARPDNPDIQRSREYFNILRQNPNVAARLENSKTGIGTSAYHAYAFLDTYGAALPNSETVFKDFTEIFSGKKSANDLLGNAINTKMMYEALNNPDSDAADKLDSNVKNALYSDLDNWFSIDTLPMDPDMRAVLTYTAGQNAWMAKGDKSKMAEGISIAFNKITSDNGSYTQTTLAWSPYRAAASQTEGVVNAIARGKAPTQWVSKWAAPETYYPSTDPFNPGLEKMIFERAMIQKAEEVFPEMKGKFIPGINLSVKREAGTSVGPQTWRLSYISDDGGDIFDTNNKGRFSFDKIYQEIKSNTFVHMKNYQAAYQHYRELTDRYAVIDRKLQSIRPDDSSEKTMAMRDEAIKIGAELVKMRRNSEEYVIPERFLLPEDMGNPLSRTADKVKKAAEDFSDETYMGRNRNK